jgi:hypothetical protein
MAGKPSFSRNGYSDEKAGQPEPVGLLVNDFFQIGAEEGT